MDLDEILDKCTNLKPDESKNYDLHSIPVSEWKDYEYLPLYVPNEVDKTSVSAACMWLENYYGFKEKGVSAYVTSDHHDESGEYWHPTQEAPSGFYFIFGDPTEEDDLANQIYADWEKQGIAGTEKHERHDAAILASQILLAETLEEEASNNSLP